MATDRTALHQLLDEIADDDVPVAARLIAAVHAVARELPSLLDSELVRDAHERDARFGDDLDAERDELLATPRPWRRDGAT